MPLFQFGTTLKTFRSLIFENMKNILITLCAFVLLLTSISCNETSLLGADLFEGEKLNLTFTDTLSINAVSETLDSVLVYSTSPYYYDSVPFGRVNDPIFGLTESRIYSKLLFDTSALSAIDLATVIIDSSFLDLVYSPSRFYGEEAALQTTQQTVGIYRLTEDIPSENIYSNRKFFATESTPIVRYNFFPKPNTPLQILKGDTTKYAARVRIPLTPSFAKPFLDINNIRNGATWFKGLEIRPEVTTTTFLNFNMGLGKPQPTGIRIYYRAALTDSVNKVFLVPVSTQHFANFQHGYKTAPIKDFVNNQAKGGEQLFLQGMSGSNVKIEFPYLKNLGKVAINKAELELTVVKDSKTDLFPAIDQLILRTAQFSPVLDLGFDSNYGDGVSARPLEKMGTSGGYIRTEIVNGETLQKYYFNLSGHLQRVLEGKSGSTIYITPHFKEEKGSRVTLYGPKASKYRAKLNVYYTKF
jgi:Domain of unknown function (DUF4270)